jgi:hypothetical protein
MISDLGEPRAQAEYRRLLQKTFMNPDPASLGVYKALDEVYPAFAKKIFENNELMKRLVLSGTNPINILTYPVCGKCETLALPTTSIERGGKKIPRCGCVAKGCGHITVNPVTFRDWLRYELKRKMPESVIVGIETAVDNIAMSMLIKCAGEMRRLEGETNFYHQKAQGLIDAYGNPINEDESKTDEELRESWQKEGYNVRSLE